LINTVTIPKPTLQVRFWPSRIAQTVPLSLGVLYTTWIMLWTICCVGWHISVCSL